MDLLRYRAHVVGGPEPMPEGDGLVHIGARRPRAQSVFAHRWQRAKVLSFTFFSGRRCSEGPPGWLKMENCKIAQKIAYYANN